MGPKRAFFILGFYLCLTLHDFTWSLPKEIRQYKDKSLIHCRPDLGCSVSKRDTEYNACTFGPFNSKQHKHFKAFFAAVDPRYPTLSRDTHPNWKVDPFLKHMHKVCKEAMHMGRNLSVDEQTVRFQGNHRDKQRITYKKEGNGFLADTICGDGYTYSFYFCHQPISLPAHLTTKYKLSPLHLRCEALFSQLKDRY